MSEVLRISTARDGGGGHFGRSIVGLDFRPILVRRITLEDLLKNGSRDNVYIISMRECVIVVQCIPYLKRTTSMAPFLDFCVFFPD